MRKYKKQTATPTGSSSKNRSGKTSGNTSLPFNPWVIYTAVAAAIAGFFALTYESPAPPPSDDPARDLLSLGQSIKHMQLHVYSHNFPDTGRGLAASKDVAAGEVVIQMPMSTAAYIGKQNLPDGFMQRCAPILEGRLGARQLLILTIIYQHQLRNSPWSLFFQSLPQQFSNLPMMTDVHRRAIKGTNADDIEYVDQVLTAVRVSVERARAFFSKQPTAEEITWATAVVASRLHPLQDELVLWPFLVLANHHYEVNKTLEERVVDIAGGDLKVWQLLANEPMHQGQQVFINYGTFSNLKLMVQYGFTIPGNPVLENVPNLLLEWGIAKASMSKFSSRLTPQGPDCSGGAIGKNAKRHAHQHFNVPEAFVKCWRLGRFDDLASAQQALEAGMFEASGIAAITASQAVSRQWLERDVLAYQDLGAACAKVKRAFSQDAALEQLHAASDAISVGLRDALAVELGSWDTCVKESELQVAAIRQFLARSTPP